MKKFSELTRKKKRTLIIVSIAVIAAVLTGILLLLQSGGILFRTAPVVTIETSGKISVSDKEPFSLELQLTDLRNDLYPAASFSISFDNSRLEFLGLEEGNVMTLGGQGASSYKLPEWSVNATRSNETGIISIMYLDTTAGKYAFTRESLSEDENVLLHLKFRLRGSARAGDVYELCFDDAVFAASDESKSLAMVSGTLRTKNGRIVIGDAKR